MALINEQHKIFINKEPFANFCRENKIAFSYYNFDGLIDKINELYDNGEIDPLALKEHLYKCLFQGRKKIVFGFLNGLNIANIKNYDFLKEKINSSFALSREISCIEDIRINVEMRQHLIDIRYYKNNNIIKHEDSIEKIDRIVFFYIYIVNQKRKSEERTIALPIHVVVDLNNFEITSRVSAKDNIYYLSGEKAEDIKLAKNCLKNVVSSLGIRYNDDINSNGVRSTVFNLHEKITKLPPEITAKINKIDDVTNEYIDQVGELLGAFNELERQDIQSSIKRIFTKQLIRSLSQKEKDSFIKFIKKGAGFSNGIFTSASSLSSIKHIGPSYEPMQLQPDYQNTLSIVDETNTINKDLIFWFKVPHNNRRNNEVKDITDNTINPNDVIRSKVHIDNNGYGIISFEEYVYEEDIENVFSKIRSFKC